MSMHFRTTAILGTLLLLSLGSTVSADSPDEPFYLHPFFYTGGDSNPLYAAAADFDEDGNQDLVVSVRNNFEFAVLLGHGNGMFDVTFVPSPNLLPASVTVADLDSNGTQDIAAVGLLGGPELVAVHMGDGAGGFGSPVYYPGGHNYVTTGDFNDDDHPDLLSPGKIFLNNGDGTFGGPISAPCSALYSVVVSDFNGDGKDDYATPYYVCLGDGQGAFTDSVFLPTGEYGYWVTAGDLNGDEIPDLVVTFESDDEISVSLGNGDGTFGSRQRYAVGDAPRYASIEDIDKDGSPDVAVANTWGSTVSLLYGSGDGSLAPAVEVSGPVVDPYSLVIADFNNDSLHDLATPSRAFDDLRLMLGDGSRSFPTNPDFGTGDGDDSVVAVGDVDADGRADLAVTNADTDDVSVLIGNGAGTFASEIRVPTGVQPSSLVFGQLTADTHLDLAVANATSNDVSILAGAGDGSFTALAPVLVGGAPSSIAAGHLNDDGDLDLAVANESNGTVTALLGNGNGTFDPAFPPTSVGLQPVDLALADFDGDTQLDLVAVSYGLVNDLRVFVGNGDGTFTPAPSPYIYPLTGPAKGLEVADLNGDGHLDLLALHGFTVNIYLGDGDATFTAGTSAGSADAVLATDVDSDGVPDLLMGVSWVERFGVRPGHGDGTFDLSSDYHFDGKLAAWGDFDLDGRVDLVGDGHSEVLIALNQTGPKSFGFLADGTTLAWPSVLGALRYDVYRGDLSALVDLDHDGLPDNDYGVCLSGLDDDTRDTFFVDTEVPTPAGAGFFYLRSSIDAVGDSGLGANSAGQARSPQVPCP